MKRIGYLVTIIVLSLVLAGCGGKSEGTAESEKPLGASAGQEESMEKTEAPVEQKEEAKVETNFPLLPDAKDVKDLNGTIIYQSNTSLDDAFAFYKEAFHSQGLTENEILTMQQDTMFQQVYTGNANGKSLIVQTSITGDNTITVTLRYE